MKIQMEWLNNTSTPAGLQSPGATNSSFMLQSCIHTLTCETHQTHTHRYTHFSPLLHPIWVSEPVLSLSTSLIPRLCCDIKAVLRAQILTMVSPRCGCHRALGQGYLLSLACTGKPCNQQGDKRPPLTGLIFFSSVAYAITTS